MSQEPRGRKNRRKITPKTPSETLIEKSEWMYENGMLELALKKATESIASNPNSYEAYLQRAKIYSALQLFRMAIDDYNHALNLETTRPELLLERGDCYQKLGKAKAALEDYTNYVKTHQKDPRGFFKRGMLFSEIDLDDAAIRDLSYAIELGEMEENELEFITYQSLVTRALLYENQMKYLRALSDVDAALAIVDHFTSIFPVNYQSVELKAFRARLFRKLGEQEESLRILDDLCTRCMFNLESNNLLWDIIVKERDELLEELGLTSKLIQNTHLPDMLIYSIASQSYTNALYN
ncbi:tetratricopeptide repeat protein [Chloroherpeton thalassium]|nr:hypothetical protein [Chloroherpeton thalassium]